MSKWHSDRLSKLQPYLFRDIDRQAGEARAAGRDVIDFGVGDPDKPTPSFIVDRMADAVRDPANHQYSAGAGSLAFRETVARYFDRRFRVTVEPVGEVLALVGSKEGLGHLPTAVMNPGETALVPDPGYPVYHSGTLFAGGICHTMPLRPENGFLPVLADIPDDVRSRARLMFLNYPNNPTSAIAPLSFFEEAVAFARDHDILIVQDAAYCELHFGQAPPSILQVAGAKEVCVEMHSLSKTFNMTGWRIGFAVGNADALAALGKVKNNMDSGVFGAIQEAGIEALEHLDHVEVRALLDVYRQRRDIVVGGLREAGWKVDEPVATFYVWAKCPAGLNSMTVVARMLDEADVVVIPGVGFGSSGDGYVRFALTVPKDRAVEAIRRIAALEW